LRAGTSAYYICLWDNEWTVEAETWCRSSEALALWREIGAPYEEATRAALSAAYQAGGDPEGAVLELHAAHATFVRLGAAPDERHVAQLLAEIGQLPAQPAAADPMTRTFMFTDIVKSTALVEAMGDEAWKEVLDWHDQTLRGLINRHGGEEINHTGDGVFASFAQPERAIECALQIQRTLADHGVRTASRPRFGSACTRRQRLRSDSITAARASTRQLASPPRRRLGRGSPAGTPRSRATSRSPSLARWA
jgi:class 3 adenylate cyclase